MELYGNLNGNSGVSYYEIGLDFIRVQFHGPAIYVYDHMRPGRPYVEHMKSLAVAGRGLGTYINEYVQKSYARKE